MIVHSPEEESRERRSLLRLTVSTYVFEIGLDLVLGVVCADLRGHAAATGTYILTTHFTKSTL